MFKKGEAPKDYQITFVNGGCLTPRNCLLEEAGSGIAKLLGASGTFISQEGEGVAFTIPLVTPDSLIFDSLAQCRECLCTATIRTSVRSTRRPS